MIDTSLLYGLRLHTPRLELRLGSRTEVQQLAAVARNGMHPPEKMPFAVAWSDRISGPGFDAEFAAYHASGLEAWRAAAWRLELLVWAAGQLVGVQGLSGEQFARRRVVSTGSWLGASAQGRGIGTEMRTAVLELAFAGLGATAATSGWLEGNLASARVSEKLGYREVGVSEVSPRGQPVVHHDLRLERDEWRTPVPVEIVGLTPAFPLFGA